MVGMVREGLVTNRIREEIDHDHTGQNQPDPDERGEIQRLLQQKPADKSDEHDARATPEGVNDRHGHRFQ